MVLGSTGEEDWTFVMLERANKIVLLLDYIVDERGQLGLFPSTLSWLTGKSALIRKTVFSKGCRHSSYKTEMGIISR